MINILIVENGRRGQGAMERAAALAGILNDKSLFNQGIRAEIVENVTAAKSKMQKEKVYAVIFFTKAMEATLKKLAKVYPATKFFVFADYIPDRKVIWVEREWLSPEFMQALVNTIER